MKQVTALILALMLSACGTVGGTLSGMGTDIGRAGEWVKSR